ncbi:hypothetical protein PROFUN_11717 [Planoprotostelium fungivorum]|uniref:Uncharacterized protein n=1 Tax=Planoprotostelium fungivorum TaxID=1890364 RepID=A0A2P6N971_9EUKA|nr:hypothetical protein PROFUN_11717 [Planoprotostelium fungivorum]
MQRKNKQGGIKRREAGNSSSLLGSEGLYSGRLRCSVDYLSPMEAVLGGSKWTRTLPSDWTMGILRYC